LAHTHSGGVTHRAPLAPTEYPTASPDPAASPSESHPDYPRLCPLKALETADMGVTHRATLAPTEYPTASPDPAACPAYLIYPLDPLEALESADIGLDRLSS